MTCKLHISCPLCYSIFCLSASWFFNNSSHDEVQREMMSSNKHISLDCMSNDCKTEDLQCFAAGTRLSFLSPVSLTRKPESKPGNSCTKKWQGSSFMERGTRELLFKNVKYHLFHFLLFSGKIVIYYSLD